MDKILLFIPMYNCGNQVIRVLEKLNNSNINVNQVLVVDNISKDDGVLKLKQYVNENEFNYDFCIMQNQYNYGLGGSHKVAFDYAIKNAFDYIIVLHGDDQADINDLKLYLENKEYKKYDCMLGSRFLKDSKLLGYSKFRTFGNIVFNKIFSIVLKKKIYDLGSGLNMYSVKMLNNKYYYKYADDLTFNCYMLIATGCYNQNIKFFNISWNEKDQVSNVRIVRQTINTLKLIFKYFIFKIRFLEAEHRENIYEHYNSGVIYTRFRKEKI